MRVVYLSLVAGALTLAASYAGAVYSIGASVAEVLAGLPL